MRGDQGSTTRRPHRDQDATPARRDAGLARARVPCHWARQVAMLVSRGGVEMKLRCIVAWVALGLTSPVMAADIAVKRPLKAIPQLYDWSGPYVGFHVGYGGGSLGSGS